MHLRANRLEILDYYYFKLKYNYIKNKILKTNDHRKNRKENKRFLRYCFLRETAKDISPKSFSSVLITVIQLKFETHSSS